MILLNLKLHAQSLYLSSEFFFIEHNNCLLWPFLKYTIKFLLCCGLVWIDMFWCSGHGVGEEGWCLHIFTFIFTISIIIINIAGHGVGVEGWCLHRILNLLCCRQVFLPSTSSSLPAILMIMVILIMLMTNMMVKMIIWRWWQWWWWRWWWWRWLLCCRHLFLPSFPSSSLASKCTTSTITSTAHYQVSAPRQPDNPLVPFPLLPLVLILMIVMLSTYLSFSSHHLWFLGPKCNQRL